VTRLVRRNYGRGHGYKLDGEKLVGVTTALGVLDKPALRDWIARTTAERAIDEWDELGELPISQRLERIRWGARDKTQAAALRGTQIHDLGEKVAHGAEVDVPDEHVGPVEAYARWLDEWQVETFATETPLASTVHKYGGTADLWGKVGRLDGALYLLDIKTGKGVYDEAAWQLAAYRYADLMLLDGAEVQVPEVAGVYVAHVLPDDVRMLPVEANPETFRSFLYILQAYREVERAREWPLIGSAVRLEDLA
jgi:hypothetical protein